MKTKLKTIAEMKLLPYQSAFAANRSRFKIGLWARQTGKDHTAQTAPGGLSTIGRKYPCSAATPAPTNAPSPSTTNS
jgi:hypothetical protein